MKKTHSKDSKKINVVLKITRLFLLIIIICCLIYIFSWFNENQKNKNLLSNLMDTNIVGEATIQIPVSEENATETDSAEGKVIEIQSYELNFENLLKTNNSTVGWINVPNTSINYPVVQADNNNFYLNHTFDKSKNTAGWIFADYRNLFDGTDKNIIIYGHNRMDTSMFATLKNTQKPNWYNNSNNKYITFTTPDETHVYEVFSVYTIKAESYYLTTYFNNDESYLNFLNEMKSRSIHNFGVNLNSTDKILTLSTCDSTGKSRVVLHAKQIE